MIRVLQGDCRDILPTLPDESVHCVVTSPPYWGLRDYGVTGQLGLEPSFQDYISTMMGVFREVRRVLRKDGTCWINMGDSYSADHAQNGLLPDNKNPGAGLTRRTRATGLKPKDLCGIPWRLAFALQADGWYLRSDIIWSKPNPMPESVTDRPTKAHEYLFLLTKSERYYYDAEAIKEESLDPTSYEPRTARNPDKRQGDKFFATKVGDHANGKTYPTRNRRTVWEIATSPFPEAHFATFPPALVEPCIKAGTSEKGCCAKCGAPWQRNVEREGGSYQERKANGVGGPYNGKPEEYQTCGQSISKTTGWFPSCFCPQMSITQGSAACTVLDPFGGAGTTGLVADRLGRNAILIELNPQYADMAERRLQDDAGLFYNADKDFSGSIDACYEAVRKRVANGGPPWEGPK